MNSLPADFLLLNASNYPSRPIFPYAFVQVSALARRAGVSSRRLDLLRVPRPAWERVLAAAVRQLRPRVIGLTLRQTDSMNAREYDRGDGREYLPVQDTRDVIRTLRRHTEVPIVVGGFGFGIQPQRTLAALEADAGIVGEPDALFECFDAFAERKLTAAPPNYLGPEGLGQRQTFGPFDGAEYTEELLDELQAFYGPQWLASAQAPTVAVEVARGCPHRCFFCAEPQVKGRTVRRRDLDAVFDDVARIAHRGLRKLWFVCSEANVGGNAMLTEITERMRDLNASRGEDRLSWTTYALPHLTHAQLEDMTASGWFLGGFNDVPSLDDDELRRGGMPYRSRHAVRFMTAMRDHARAHRSRADDWAVDRRRHLGLFLAAPTLTAAGLRTVLTRLDEAGMLPGADRRVAESAFAITALRVYDDDGDVTRPRFTVPAALSEALGGVGRVAALQRYLETVLLCDAHRRVRDDSAFVAPRRRRLAAWVGTAAESLAYAEVVTRLHERLGPLWQELGLTPAAGGAPAASDYAVARALWNSARRGGGIRALLRPHVGSAWPLVCSILVHEYSIPLDPPLLRLVLSP